MTPKIQERVGSKMSKQTSGANSYKRIRTTRFSKSRSCKNFKGFESSAEKSKKSLRSTHSKMSRKSIKSLKSIKSQLKVNEASNKELRNEIRRLNLKIISKDEITDKLKLQNIKYRELLYKLEKSEMLRREQAEKVKAQQS